MKMNGSGDGKSLLGVCIKCNENGAVELKQELADKFWSSVKERSDYGDVIGNILLKTDKDKTFLHTNCYKTVTHKGNIERLKSKFEAESRDGIGTIRRGRKRKSTDIDNYSKKIVPTFIRSTPCLSVIQEEEKVCFFCDSSDLGKENLRASTTGTRDKIVSLLGENVTLWHRLQKHSLSGDQNISYHATCYTQYIRSTSKPKKDEERKAIMRADAEFSGYLTSTMERQSGPLKLNDVHQKFCDIRQEYGLDPMDGRVLKTNLEQQFGNNLVIVQPDHKKPRQLIDIKQVGSLLDQKSKDPLLSAAEKLRKDILKREQNEIPASLKQFLNCLVYGSEVVENDNTQLADTIIHAVKTNRQIRHLPKKKGPAEKFRNVTDKETLSSITIAVNVHTATRSRTMIDYLYECGITISYKRLLQIENELATAVLRKAQNGVYIPHGIVKNKPVYFAADNIDFKEDTYDGKNTTHSTVIVMFQPQQVAPKRNMLEIINEAKEINDNKKDMVYTTPARPSNQDIIVPENVKPKPLSFPKVDIHKNGEIFNNYSDEDTTWRVARNNIRNNDGKMTIPVWSAYHSLKTTDDESETTLIRTLPLIAQPAHEFSTLVLVLKQVQTVSAEIVGKENRLVITFDMDLYKKARKLVATYPEFKNVVVRVGELHVVLCALRAIGNSIEGSGIDDAWVESDVYSAATTTQILNGKHMKRAIEAHKITQQVFFDLLCDVYMKQIDGQTKNKIQKVVDQLAETISDDEIKTDNAAHKAAHNSAHCDLELFRSHLKDFVDGQKKTGKPMMQWACMYLDMVNTLLQFIKASRLGEWSLHLSSLDKLCTYFFANDRLVYAQHIPLYLADMYNLEADDPELWMWLSRNFSVKKSAVPFTMLGVDHALEQENRKLKVQGGIKGLTQRPESLKRFFLIGPVLLDVKSASLDGQRHHHEISERCTTRQESMIEKVKEVIAVNPFEFEGDMLTNIVNMNCIEDKITKSILTSHEKGRELYNNFTENRIKGKDNIWGKMKKSKILHWKDSGKKVVTKIENECIELKEERSLFARLAIIARSNRDIDMESSIGNYEFSVVCRSLLAADGSILLPTHKSALINELEIPDKEIVEHNSNETNALILDGMAIVQENKQQRVDTCGKFAEIFCDAVSRKASGYSRVHVVFDHYDVENSLKSKTREARTQGRSEKSTYSLCTDKTPIKKSLDVFLASRKTKHYLTIYLQDKLMENFRMSSKTVIASTSAGATSNREDVSHLTTSIEEADSTLILHAEYETQRGSIVTIESPDTDVFVLAIARFPSLNPMTTITLGSSPQRRKIPLKQIYEKLGPKLAAALPAFHAFTGADNCGRFFGKGKVKCWRVFKDCPSRIWESFASLGKECAVSSEVKMCLEEFVCRLYRPASSKTISIPLLRWEMFLSGKFDQKSLPPTLSSLEGHIKRAHLQAVIWMNTNLTPSYLDPEMYGWKFTKTGYKPETAKEIAPAAVLSAVTCRCKKSNCSTKICPCRKHDPPLPCTELCGCRIHGECSNCHVESECDEDIDDNEDIDDDENIDDEDTDSEDDQ